MLKVFRVFYKPEDVYEWTKIHYTEDELQLLNVNNDLSTPLSDYKGSGYRCMNEYIRLGYIEYQKDFDIKGLQTFLCSRTIDDSIQVYRFVDIIEFVKLLWNTRCKRLYKYPGFLSTTLLKDFYSMTEIRKKRLVISINIPKGSLGTYVSEVNPELPEFEILLPYYTKLNRVGIMKYEVVGIDL